MTKTVLCYGDSNTWGFDPRTKERFGVDTRWPGVLRAELGHGFHVIEEGLNGRTTVWTDPLGEYRNGKHLLIPCLETHKPLDLVILMLGTNDLKAKFSATALDIAKGAGLLVDMIQQSRTGPGCVSPKVLLICPLPLARLTELAELFEGATEKSRRLSAHYQNVANELGCSFLNAGDLIQCSELDGIHLDAEAHAAVGKAIAAETRRIL